MYAMYAVVEKLSLFHINNLQSDSWYAHEIDAIDAHGMDMVDDEWVDYPKLGIRAAKCEDLSGTTFYVIEKLVV